MTSGSLVADVRLPEGDADEVAAAAARYRVLAERLGQADRALARWPSPDWRGDAGTAARGWVLALRTRVTFERDRNAAAAAALSGFAGALTEVAGHRARCRTLLARAEEAQGRAALLAAGTPAAAVAGHHLAARGGMWDGEALRLRAAAAEASSRAWQLHRVASARLATQLERWAGPAPLPPPPPVAVDLVLDAVGFVPVVGDGVDLLRAVIALGEGRTEDGLLMAAASAPFVGGSANSARASRSAAKVGSSSARRRALDILSARVSREGAKRRHVRMMDTDEELTRMYFDEIAPLGRSGGPLPDAPGSHVTIFDDGMRVQFRLDSGSGGATIELKNARLEFGKVHTRMRS